MSNILFQKRFPSPSVREVRKSPYLTISNFLFINELNKSSATTSLRRTISKYFYTGASSLLSSYDIVPPRLLRVPQLPNPPFFSSRPARFFWHPAAYRDGDAIDGSAFPLIRDTYEGPPLKTGQEENVLNYIREHLSQKGTVKKDHRGFIYVDVESAYLTVLLDYIKGIEMPPFGGFDGPLGAHFAIILPNELTSRAGLESIVDLPQEISFEVTGCYSLRPAAWQGVAKVWYLTIRCLEAESIREKYLLPPKIFGHPFLIPIAIKKTKVKDRAAKQSFRINVSCLAV